jgi:hypothetical protein
MKAMSKVPAPPAASRPSSVSTAGASRSSTRSATPASAQARSATSVYSFDTSQQTICPPGGSARAIAVDEYPVKVPTSTIRRAPVSWTSSASSAPSSTAICICDSGIRAVASRSRRRTSGSRTPNWAR